MLYRDFGGTMKTVLLILLLAFNATAAVRVAYKVENGKSSLVSARAVDRSIVGKKLLRQIPYFIGEGNHLTVGSAIFEEYEISDDLVTAEIQARMRQTFRTMPNAEFREVVVQ